MAVVWRAWDPKLEREVAIKEPVLPSGADASAAIDLSARFVREGKAAAALNHPGIVTIYAADIYEGRPAIVMELIDGETLADVLSRGPLSTPSTLAVLDQLLDTVGYAHSRGVVHRDIKPDNIFVTTGGHVKLADFGIAHTGDNATLTQAGTVMGTPGYMAPEQVTGQPVDARADLFAIGVIGYEMLTGRNPFGATDGVATTTIMYRIVHEPLPLPALSGSGASSHLVQVIEAATAKDADTRFPDASTFRAALSGGAMPARTVPGAPETVLAYGGQGTASSRKPTWLPYAAVGAVGVLVVAALLLSAVSGGASGRSGTAAPSSSGGAAAPTAQSTPNGGASGGTPQASPSTPGIDRAAAEADIRTMLEDWRVSRETLDFNAYIALYSSDFYSTDSGGQNYAQWAASKRKIYRTTAAPSITFSNISIAVSSDGQSADGTLDQRYRSSSTSDDGQKAMTLRRGGSDGSWLITREDFTRY